jgi:hypothetical protein
VPRYSLVDTPELVGFFSYSREDDEDSRGALSALRDAIQRELRGQLDRSRQQLRLWQDKEAIAPGRLWESEIKAAVDQAAFFIPIITPTVVKSHYCHAELDAFLTRERALERSDLMFPILYIRVPELEVEASWRDHPVLSVIGARQWVDWRHLRLHSIDDLTVREAIEKFCATIVTALRAPTPAPEELERRREEEARQAEEAHKTEAEQRRQQEEDEQRRKREEEERQREVRKTEEAREAEAAVLAEETRKRETEEAADRLAEEGRRELAAAAGRSKHTAEERKRKKGDAFQEAAQLAEEKPRQEGHDRRRGEEEPERKPEGREPSPEHRPYAGRHPVMTSVVAAAVLVAVLGLILTGVFRQDDPGTSAQPPPPATPTPGYARLPQSPATSPPATSTPGYARVPQNPPDENSPAGAYK